MTWHPPMAYRYSYRTHDGYAMLLADSGGYPRRWIKGPKITSENVESPRCSHCNGHGKIVHSSGAAPACSACGGTGRTPDNVEEPT